MTKNAMSRWTKPELIVVATNLFEGYRLMLHAIYQASLSNAKVLLVHVIPPSYSRGDAAFSSSITLPSPAVPTVKAKLEELAEEFWRAGILCEPVVLRGLPAEQIPLFVKLRSADRVIVASSNVTGVARLVGQSVAQELISVLNVPVCVIGRRIRPGASGNTPLGRVLLATPLHPSSLLLVNFAKRVAELNHSYLSVLHVLDTEGMDEQQRNEAQWAARRKLTSLVHNRDSYTDQPSLLIREGDAAAGILGEAGSMPQDLVILGSANRSTASCILSNSVAHRVVLESQCPVIIVNYTTASKRPGGIRDVEARLVYS